MFKKILAIAAMLYAAASFAAVDVNKANADELDSLKGIGPVMAKKIVDERKNGKFKDWSDFVSRVKGAGGSMGAKLSAEGMTVDGQSLNGAPAMSSKDKAGKADQRAIPRPGIVAPAGSKPEAAPMTSPALQGKAEATSKSKSKAKAAEMEKK